MQPGLFRRRLLELAAEYESLHAAAAPARHGTSRSSSLDRASRAWQPAPPLAEDPPPGLWPEPAEHGAPGGPDGGGGKGAGPPGAPSCPPAGWARTPSSESGLLGAGIGTVPSLRSQDTLSVSQQGSGTGALGFSRHATAKRLDRLKASASSLFSGAPSDSGRSSFWESASNEERSKFERAVRKTVMYLRGSANSRAADPRPLAGLVRSRHFAVAIACLVILSILLIGIETQVLASLSNKGSGSEQMLAVLSAANYAFTLLFTLEMVARIYVFRLDFFVEERMWNCFDLIILLLAIAEVALELVVRSLSGGGRNPLEKGGTAKILRLFRLSRLLRLVRTFRQLKPLRMLVHSIVCAGRSVFWALMLLLMIVYAFGVVLTQAVTEHTQGDQQSDDELLMAYYGDLVRSMLSLWMAVSGGISWVEVTEPLDRIGNATWKVLFLLYIIFVYFFIWR
ncbi:unnamed protein product, partial [Prorocentrum cordatum]